MADDGREPEDGQRFPSCVVEDRRRRRPSGRGTCQGVDVLAVRRTHRGRRGRDRLQEGPRVSDRGVCVQLVVAGLVTMIFRV